MWTRNDILSMSEDDLRTQILMPLFRAMGYQDVVDHHGGPHEQGKDLVMWKVDPILGRQNYAVVAKAERISGRAEGKGSASVVLFQILQSFGKAYLDPNSSDERRVDQVFVVCSDEITTEATTALRSALGGTHAAESVTLVDINKLWEWIREFMPRDALLDLHHIGRVLGEADDRIKFSVLVRDGEVQVGFEPREGQPPIEIKLGVNFPTTPEGMDAAAAFDRHRRTGEPVQVDGDFITTFDVPDSILAMLPGKPSKIAIESAPVTPRPVLRLRLEVHPRNGPPVTLSGLEFRVLQSGDEQGTLTNEHQGQPWVIRLTLTHATRAFGLQFKVRPEAYPVSRVLQTVNFQNALAEGGVMHVFDEDVELPIASQEFSPGAMSRFSDDMKLLFEAIYDIQIALTTPIIVPRQMQHHDIREARRIHGIIKSGRDRGSWTTLHVTVPRTVAQSLADGSSSEREMCIALWSEDSIEQVLGTAVNLGPVLTILCGLTLTDDGIAEVQRQLASGAEEIAMDLMPMMQTDNAEQYFPKLLSAEEIAILRTQVPMRWLPAETDEASPAPSNMSILFHRYPGNKAP